MNPRLNFASDNASGAHPDVLTAIQEANVGSAPAYGNDDYSAQVAAKICTAFDVDAEVLFTFGGTGANVVALASITRSFEAIFCSDCSHIWSDECAAPQKFIGCKIVPVQSRDGKITAADIAANLGPDRGVHHARPKVVSLTQPTELGTLYSLQELASLSAFCRENRLTLHVDGARFANAAAALDVSLARLSHQAGVDVLSFGGTKNGALGAEAVICFNRDLAAHGDFMRKQVTQLPSKMRFIAAQFDALFTNELWLRNARNANAMALRLAEECASNDVDLLAPQQVNAVFPYLAPQVVHKLQEDCDFYVWDEARHVARWMTSFNTTGEEISRFSELIRAALKL
ncbi:MAG: threonine aldolase family protein [Gammaproteobacteria bacterium]